MKEEGQFPLYHLSQYTRFNRFKPERTEPRSNTNRTLQIAKLNCTSTYKFNLLASVYK